jgi:hypothetical protein
VVVAVLLLLLNADCLPLQPLQQLGDAHFSDDGAPKDDRLIVDGSLA